MSKINLAVNVGGLKMRNPVMTASGTFGFGKEYAPYVDLDELGAIVVKGTTLQPKAGNPMPRIVETPSGILNAIGLENPGVEYVINHELPSIAQYTVPVIVNISGNTLDQYAEMAERLSEVDRVAALEVNISCPNVKKGGLAFGTDPVAAADVTTAVRKATKKPIIVKLSPNVTSITDIAKSVEAAGADAISLINTLLGMSIDIETRRPRLGNTVGGLSGPAIKPVAVRMVWQVAQAVKVPLVGMGGIMNAADAIEFMLAGATSVSIGTANFVNPRATIEIVEGIEQYLREHNLSDVHEIIGKVEI